MDKKINVINSTINNSNLSSGDNNIQFSSSNNTELDKMFKSLIEIIEQESPSDEKNDALENAKKLQEAVINNDKPRAKRIFNWLPTVVQASSVGIEIYKLISS